MSITRCPVDGKLCEGQGTLADCDRCVPQRRKARPAETERLTVREACRRRMPLDGADAQALEHALSLTERERDAGMGSIKGIFDATPEGDKRDNSICPNCDDNHHGPQKAIVAVSAHSTSAVVVWSTPALACDMREAMLDAGDVWDLSKVDGLTVWEGHIIVFSCEGPEGTDWDVDYQGTFRPMAEADWALLRDEVQPGDPIVECSCPCCGATLEVMHGDDEGQIGVVGTLREE